MATPLSPVLVCTEFVAVEGRYELLQDIHMDSVLPHPAIPTRVSSVSVKYKDYLKAASSGGAKGGVHGKQSSADSTLSASNLDRLEERLKDIRLKDERGAGGDEEESGTTPEGTAAMARNMHLTDLPQSNNDSPAGPLTPALLSPGLPQISTPGPPSSKDTVSSGRLSDPYSQFGPPPPMPQQSVLKSLSRPNSFSQGMEDPNGSSAPPSATGSSNAGFSAFFGGKRKKPKNNITKTNSTFVTKITTHENLAKILAGRTGEDVYLFWNTGRTFSWTSLDQKPNEPLSRILFSKAFPTSHDVNILTRSCDHLDVIIGFSTGDIMWFDPLCNKYYRLNKQAIIKDSAVTMIKWMPGSESQFIAAFHDGSILIMDKERDDSAFSAPIPPDDNTFQVTRPKHGKHNPISHWQVCKKPITAFAFSPDLQHVAVVSTDGCLRIIDFRDERLLDTFSAYFGALNCVCWSPDGKYILTGGQDDLVTIWSFKDQRIVARCQGHQSYVTGVAFDPWRCDERNYRFGSVGEDAKLLLWDFSVGALHKPKAVVAAQRRGSTATIMSTTVGGATSGYKPGHGSKGSISSLRGNGGHSLFSGHLNNKPATSAIHQHHQNHSHRRQPPIAEELAHEHESHHFVSHPSQLRPSRQSQNGEGSSASSLMGDGASVTPYVYSSTLVSDTGRNRAYSVSTAMTGKVTSASSMMTDETAVDAGSSNEVYKKSAYARTLPHLHLHRPNFQRSGTEEVHGGDQHHQDQHQHQHQQHHGQGFSSLFRYGNNSQSGIGVQIVRPPEPRSHVAMLQPLMAKAIHQEPLSGITFREDAIMTSDRMGHIKAWKRPPPLPHYP